MRSDELDFMLGSGRDCDEAAAGYHDGDWRRSRATTPAPWGFAAVALPLVGGRGLGTARGEEPRELLRAALQCVQHGPRRVLAGAEVVDWTACGGSSHSEADRSRT